jgi:arsenate reductase
LLSILPELLKLNFENIIRTKEEAYKMLKLDSKKLTNKEWIETLKEYPVLLERPIFIYKNKAVIARPPELVKTIL